MMERLKSWFGRASNQSASTPTGDLESSGYRGYLVENFYTPDRALSFPAFTRAASLISESVAGLDYYVVDAEDKKYLTRSSVLSVSSEAGQLLGILRSRDPGSFGAYDLFRLIILDLVFFGNAFLVKRRLNNGALVGLDLARPESGQNLQSFRLHSDTFRLRIIKPGGDDAFETHNVRFSDIVHFKAPVIQPYFRGENTGVWGVAPAKIASVAIALGMCGQDFIRRFYTEAYNPGFVFYTETTTSPSQREEFQRSISKSRGSRTPRLFSSGIKPVAIPENKTSAMIEQNHQTQVREVSRTFGVPMELMSEVSTSGTNIEQISRLFYRWSLSHWINNISRTISQAILPEDLQFDFDSGRLLRGDYASVASLVGVLLGGNQGHPVGTVNEARKFMGLGRWPDSRFDKIPEAVITEASQNVVE